jgi:hypothetical protein
MTTTMATATLVLGVAGTLAMLGYRTAVRCVDLRVVPAHLAARARWWNDRVTSMLQASLLLTMAGLIGLLSA